MTSCSGLLIIYDVLAHGHIVVTVFFNASDEGGRNPLFAAPGKIHRNMPLHCIVLLFLKKSWWRLQSLILQLIEKLSVILKFIGV